MSELFRCGDRVHATVTWMIIAKRIPNLSKDTAVIIGRMVNDGNLILERSFVITEAQKMIKSKKISKKFASGVKYQLAKLEWNDINVRKRSYETLKEIVYGVILDGVNLDGL